MGLKDSGLRGSLRNVSVGIDAIPDSAIHHYITGDFTESNWPDDIGNIDIDDIDSGISFNSTAFDGSGGVSGDGNSVARTTDNFNDFGNNVFASGGWAVAFQFEGYTDSGEDHFINSRETDGVRIEIGSHGFGGGDEDKLTFQVQGSGRSDERHSVESDMKINDGGTYTAICQMEGLSAEDMFIYFSETDGHQNILTNENDVTSGDLSRMWYFGADDAGETEVTLNDVFWFEDSLDENQRSNVFGYFD